MSEDRPMDEYEGALFSALTALTQAIAHGTMSRKELAAKYREAAPTEREFCKKNAEAVLELLARAAETDRAYSAARPPLTVLHGGKDGSDSSN